MHVCARARTRAHVHVAIWTARACARARVTEMHHHDFATVLELARGSSTCVHTSCVPGPAPPRAGPGAPHAAGWPGSRRPRAYANVISHVHVRMRARMHDRDAYARVAARTAAVYRRPARVPPPARALPPPAAAAPLTPPRRFAPAGARCTHTLPACRHAAARSSPWRPPPPPPHPPPPPPPPRRSSPPPTARTRGRPAHETTARAPWGAEPAGAGRLEFELERCCSSLIAPA